MQYKIPRLDIMIAYSCNISCRGCISLSNFKRDGVEPYDLIAQSVSTWSKKLNPAVIVMFGGEPLLHPKFTDILAHVRTCWPKSTIRVITNGLLLDKISPDKWFDYGDFELQVSVHREEFEHQINQSIKKIASVKKGWVPSKHQTELDHKQFEISIPGFRIWKSKFKDFVAPYRKLKGELIPHSSDPALAHKQCGSPDSPVLYKGKLYKCPPVANLIDIQGQWAGYSGISCIDDVANFVESIGRPEAVCSACPDNPKYRYNHFNPINVQPKNSR